jgi:hypothetical protein
MTRLLQNANTSSTRPLLASVVWKWGGRALFLVTAVGSSSAIAHKSNTIERYSIRSGNVVRLHPSDASFEIPQPWLGPETRFRLTRTELGKVRKNDNVNFVVADSTLNFRDCATQIELDNGSPWLRAYIVDLPVEEILKQIRGKGPKAVRKIPNFIAGHTRGFQIEPKTEGTWQHIDVPFMLDYGDTSEGGAVSFYLAPLGHEQLVIVVGFMGNHHHDQFPVEVQSLLKSVVVSKSFK